MNEQVRQLFEISNATIVSGRENYTHYLPADNKHCDVTRWRVISFDKFWPAYCELAEMPDEFSIYEHVDSDMPIITELKLVFHKNDINEFYGKEFLLHYIHCHQETITELLNVEKWSNKLYACVLESLKSVLIKDENDEEVYVTRIRLQFPFCRIDRRIQRDEFRPVLIKKLCLNNIIGKLYQLPIIDLNKSLDVGMENVPMYGSKVDESHMALTHIYKRITQKHLLDPDGFELKVDLSSVFQPHLHQHCIKGLMNTECFDDFHLEFWLPLFLSVNFWTEVTMPNHERQQTNMTKVKKITSDGMVNEHNIDVLVRLLKMLKTSRFKQRRYLLDVCSAIFNAFKSSNAKDVEEYFDLWRTYVEQYVIDPKEQLEYLEMFTHMNNSYVTVKTIAWYAREDNPEEYKVWFEREWCAPAIQNAIFSNSLAHADVAEAIYKCFWLEFVCASSKNRWFQFRGHTWCETDSTIVFMKAICTKFVDVLAECRFNVTKQLHDSSPDADRREKLETLISRYTKLIDKIKDNNYLRNVLSMARMNFHHEKFLNIVDENPDLIGLENGVIELVEGKAVIRPGKPEDFVTKTTGIYINEKMSYDHPQLRELKDWIKKVFPDKDLRHYFWKFAASCLKGRNQDKIFLIWTGEGNNSKSMVVKLFEQAFGSYCFKIPVSSLSGRRSAGAATPEYARSKSTRIGFFQEPGKTKPLHDDAVKKACSGDSEYYRNLYDTGREITMTYKTVLMCNSIPVIINADKAIENRVVVLPFNSFWSEDAPDDPEEQKRLHNYKLDPFFEFKIPKMAPAFLWYIVQYYEKYAQEGLKPPKAMKDSTRKYWDETNPYYQFISESIQVEEIPKSQLTFRELYEEFVDWFTEAYPAVKVPSKPIVRSEFVAKWGRPIDNTWTGVRFNESIIKKEIHY